MTAPLLLAAHHCNHLYQGPLWCNVAPRDRGASIGLGVAVLTGGFYLFWQSLTAPPKPKKKGKR